MMKTAGKLLINGLAILLFFYSTPLVKAASSAADGEVGFAANTSPPPIVNPLEPDTEIETDAEGTAGPLSIDYVPTLNFGSNEISTYDKIYYAASNTATAKEGDMEITIPNFVQVTDNRGTKAGWTLSATASDFTTEDGEILTGADITFTNAHVYTPNSQGDEPTAVNPVVLEDASISYPILKAANGQGAATWGVYYAGTDDDAGEGSIILNVPGESTKMAKTYTSTITWTLAETP